MIYIKNQEQIAQIKKACAIWKQTRDQLLKYIKPGLTTKQVDLKAKEIIESLGGIPTFYKLYNFPGHICICVNEQLIHGVGSDYVLQPNDLVTCDIGVTYNNYVCDAAFSLVLSPSNDPEKLRILEATTEALDSTIELIAPGVRIGDLSHNTEKVANQYGYKVVQDFAGHGCGLKPHEDPIILNYGTPNTGPELKPGMIICLEPMFLTDDYHYTIDKKDRWTVSSKNKKLTCHVEHMILVTDTGHEVLTK